MLSIQLDRDIERRVADLARRMGRTTSDVARELIEMRINDLEVEQLKESSRQQRRVSVPGQDVRKERGQHRATAWLDAVKRFPHTPPLSDEAISRESIYNKLS
jgi:predicted DNA-binding protein